MGALYSLLFVGFDFGTYLEYNFLYPDIYQHPTKYSGTAAELALNATAQKWFTLLFLPALQTPWISISLGVCLKTLNFVVAFYFLSKVAKLRCEWVLFGALILSSFSLFSDLSGEVEFTRGALAFTGIFLGAVLVLQGKVLLGYLFCAVAILIHPLDALSVFGFLVAGLLGARLNRQELRRHLVGVTPVIFAVGWVALEAPSTTQHLELSISQWYREIIALEGDDVTLLWHFRENWLVVCGLIIPGLVSIIPRPSSRIEQVFIGMIVLLGIVLALECLHYLGFSFGFVSEKFIALQFRRGFWLPLLVAIAVVAKVSEQGGMSRRDSKLLVGGLVVLLIFPKEILVIGLALIAVVYLIVFGDRKRRLIALLITVCIVASVLFRAELGTEIDLKDRQFIFLLLGLTMMSGWFFLMEQVGATRAFVVLTAVFIALKIGNNIAVEKSPVLKEGVDHIVQATQLKEPTLILGWLLARSEGQALKMESAALSALPEASNALAAPLHSGYTAPIRARGALSFSRWDGLVVYSRAAAERYLKMRDSLTNGLNPCPTTIGSSTACVLTALATRIDSMTGGEIAAFSKEFGLDYVIRRKELNDQGFKLVFSNREYFVYQVVLDKT